MQNIFNKGAFKIKTKSHDPIKYLDGGFRFEVRVDHFESGDPVTEDFTVYKDLLGNIAINHA